MRHYAHPYHFLTDAEQARIRWVTMATMPQDDGADWHEDHSYLLLLKRVCGIPRHQKEPPRPPGIWSNREA